MLGLSVRSGNFLGRYIWYIGTIKWNIRIILKCQDKQLYLESLESSFKHENSGSGSIICLIYSILIPGHWVSILLQSGNIRGALEGLALTLQDPSRAEALCQKLGEHSYVILLEVLLDPKDGQPPLYKEACRLLSSHGKPLFYLLFATPHTLFAFQHSLKWEAE